MWNWSDLSANNANGCLSCRLLGGWTTLSHFLERHGGDPTQEISAADLLPLDTRSVKVSPRRRSCAPLVSPQYPQSAQTTPNTPTFGRYISSTPVSRRSSLSSPEPWMSASSGYSSSSVGCTGSPPAVMPTLITRRRRSSTEAPCRRRVLTHRASVGQITTHQMDSQSRPTTPSRPTSEPIKSRYPNYLNSSQHITNRANMTNMTNLTNGLIGSPSLTNLAKQNIFRKPVQKTC